MAKLLITSVVISAFALTGVTGSAAAQQPAQSRLCSNAPKNYVPCPALPQKPQQTKT
jgi:hypothetical protein